MHSLEEMLLKEGVISKKRLDEATWLAKRKGSRLLETLLSVGFVSEDEAVKMFEHQGVCPVVELNGPNALLPVPDQNLAEILPQDFAQNYQVLPLFRSLDSLIVAVLDPTDLEITYELEKLAGVPAKVLAAKRSQLKKAIKDFYGTPA